MRLRLTGAAIAAGALLAACGSSDREPPLAGDPERGRLLLRQYGCGGCHRIPEVPAADADVGPPLAGVGRRVYLAGVLPNSPDNMVRWIRAPQAVKPQTTMPDLQVQQAHAVDMVAYLQRLR
jgi:cytochrome c2